MAIRIEPVRTRADLRRFILFPWRIYRGTTRNPYWVPPLIIGEKDLLSPKKNPFYAHADHQHFLAYRGTELVGRISAILDHNYVQFHEEKVAFFGFFESFDDIEIAGALFGAAADWARAKGMPKMIGPMNPNADHILGVLIDSFSMPPVVQMGYNPPYYPVLYERSGFAKERDLLCYRMLTSTLPLSDKIKRVADMVQKRSKVTLRTIDMRRFREEVERIRDVYNDAWEKNWGFVPWTREEFDFMAGDLRLIGDPRIVLLAEIDGKPIGVSIPIPDVNEVLIRMNGRLLPFGILRFLLGRRKISMIRIAIMGVARGYHNRGIDALMAYETYRRGSEVGYKGAEMSWVLEDNHALCNLLDNWGAERYRTYRVYGKNVS